MIPMDMSLPETESLDKIVIGEERRKLRALWAQVEEDLYDFADWALLGNAIRIGDATALGMLILQAHYKGQHERLETDPIDEAKQRGFYASRDDEILDEWIGK